MLDVGYYLLEADLNSSTVEQSKAQVVMRDSLYKSIYNKEYKFGESHRKRSYDFDSEIASGNLDQPLEPFDPSSNPGGIPRDYSPPPEFNDSSSMPFGEILDSPMN